MEMEDKIAKKGADGINDSQVIDEMQTEVDN